VNVCLETIFFRKGKEITTIATSTSEENGGHISELLKCINETISLECMKGVDKMLRTVSTADTLQVSESVQIVKKKKVDSKDELKNFQNLENTSLIDNIHRFAQNHVVKIKLWDDFLSPRESRTFFGSK
jgi:Flp pilus assembly secretin CpaC